MRAAGRLAVFGGGLVAVLVASVGLGRLAGPVGVPVAAHEGESGGHQAEAAGHGEAAHLPGGLQVAEDGYRLVPESRALAVGEAQAYRFRIVGADGAAVTRYETEHEKQLHLIVVRRDLSGFRHVHPELGADGVWSVLLGVAAAGQYRVFADFRPAGHERGLTLGVDVPAAGDYQPEPLPVIASSVTVDGYTVTLDGTLTPGTSSTLTLSVAKDGVPATDLEPYLGAYGHLVALRDGDLAYLHVHPEGAPGDGRTAAGPGVTFVAEVPSVGVYRLYLDFQHGGQVRTAAFTVAASGPGSTSGSGSGAAGHSHEPGDHSHDGATDHSHDGSTPTSTSTGDGHDGSTPTGDGHDGSTGGGGHG